ncbi:cell division protein ZipA [Acinetobacter ursingii]|uniref:Cell division protein ZipA n=1 Tax=Acinetobacter ursingii TaxID=108980 RepID=A0AA46NLL6_9GAMM|nr:MULTISPECIES: cell division protein ZipA C-terminal FtsZ-binding domain-containing protein [Acinetobacter]MDA3580581.1 cell division protein ZipA [Acinetobacter ursingii]MDH0807533.1 cell division protein ZipA [Acinetobacter ursingii]MDH2019333.1 cell division protein ZipA [Acinetobacter ursingii]MDH2071782.1 cell division protein ZipA [Acinetobacter ursingii]MDH2075037.1 cell division protein ZipA [Acinetobacter ursingii]
MEVTTIVGIVAAIIIMIVGLRMVLRKPAPTEPSLESALHIDPESNQPIIPRHVRDQLPAETPVEITAQESERKEPALQDIPETLEDQAAKTLTSPELSEDKLDKEMASVDFKTEETTLKIEQPLEQQVAVVDVVEAVPASDAELDPANIAVQADEAQVQHVKKIDEFQLNPEIEAATIAEFDGESNLLDVHLHEQQLFDDESALATAQEIVALNVYPNPRRALSGDKTLKVLLKYGLRFGEMACFHRYDKTDEPSPLMFSVLRMTDNGPAGFDLETLSSEQVQGLAFFLALPHQDALKGFDMMTSIAGLIAREVDGKVFDENNLEFTPQLKEHWRHHVIDYRSTQETA